jgi:hypothetical protein
MPTVKLTTQLFKEEIFDYTTHQTWEYKGKKPAIIDFSQIGVVPVKWWPRF